MPNQYNAADLTNVPRTYHFYGESNVASVGDAGAVAPSGNSNIASYHAINATNGSFTNATSRTYPLPSGTGSYSSNTGDNSPSGVNFAVHVGYGVDTVRWVGYYDRRPLASGVLGANITHTVTVDPSGLNGGLLDPWLQNGA